MDALVWWVLIEPNNHNEVRVAGSGVWASPEPPRTDHAAIGGHPVTSERTILGPDHAEVTLTRHNLEGVPA